MNDSDLYEQAKRQVGFKRHALTYVLINLLLIGVDFMDNGRLDWFWSPLLGWGIGLAVHGFSTYWTKSLFSVEKEMDALRRKNKNIRQ